MTLGICVYDGCHACQQEQVSCSWQFLLCVSQLVVGSGGEGFELVNVLATARDRFRGLTRTGGWGVAGGDDFRQWATLCAEYNICRVLTLPQ